MADGLCRANPLECRRGKSIGAPMQLSLLPDDRTVLLASVQRRLRERLEPWVRESRRDPVGTLIHGLVGWKTQTELTITVVDALEAEFGRWEGVRDADQARLEAVIAPVTFANLKAPRIQAALAEITRREEQLSLGRLDTLTVPAAIAWLETLPSVGRKIAAEVLNASTFERLALVIDGHHHRVVRRLGLVRATATVAEVYDTLMPLLPPDWTSADLDAHHMLVKQLGRMICRHDVPECERCPLVELCATGRDRTLEPASRPGA